MKTPKYPIQKNLGFSLVELLIAMIIGLFLLAGITSSYLHSKKNSVQRDQYSILEDNGRAAIELLKNTLQHTGYASINTASINGVLNGGVQSVTCSNGAGQSVINTGLFPNTLTADNATDSIGIVYLGDDRLSTDCANGPLPDGCQLRPTRSKEAAKIYNYFYLRNDPQGTPFLMCAGSRSNQAVELAEGIENMQILYGVDTDGDKQINRYINATDVGNFRDNILSIQIALLVRSLIEVKDQAEQKTYSLLDQSYTNPVADRYQRAVFTTTISLRNTH